MITLPAEIRGAAIQNGASRKSSVIRLQVWESMQYPQPERTVRVSVNLALLDYEGYTIHRPILQNYFSKTGYRSDYK